MASAAYQPYGAVTNSYNQFMGGGTPSGMPNSIPRAPNNPIAGPIKYNTSVGNLRATGDTTNINTAGNLTSEQRIDRMADKQYEKWKAAQEARMRVQGEFDAAKSDALGGMEGVQYNNYARMQGGQTPYQQFMSNQGAAGLFGGSTRPTTSSNFGSRSSDWNESIYGQANAYNRAMAPVFQQFGVQKPGWAGRISTLW